MHPIAIGLLIFSASVHSDPYEAFDSVNDGSAAARLGTVIYNSMHPDQQQLPVHDGDGAVIKETIQNLGAGNTPKNAWRKAAESQSGANKVDK